jgi:hypothetical protein
MDAGVRETAAGQGAPYVLAVSFRPRKMIKMKEVLYERKKGKINVRCDMC